VLHFTAETLALARLDMGEANALRQIGGGGG
jgi:hypothetical protein